MPVASNVLNASYQKFVLFWDLLTADSWKCLSIEISTNFSLANFRKVILVLEFSLPSECNKCKETVGCISIKISHKNDLNLSWDNPYWKLNVRKSDLPCGIEMCHFEVLL